MKKILTIATLIVSALAILPAQAGNNKKNKNKDKKAEACTEACCAPAKFTSTADSISYAAGYAATRGLMPYLQQRLHVDTVYINEFLRGFREAVAKAKDPAYVAYQAGTTIAQQATESILPGMGREFKDTKDSLRSNLFYEGFLAAVKGDTTIYKEATASKYFEQKAEAVRNAKNAAWKTENEKWLADNAAKPGVVTMPDGLQYKVLKAGNGPKPTADQTVEVKYEGKTIDGKVFDATEKHGGKGSDSFRCDQVIKGWTEALTNMPVGSKWEVYIPQNLAYGEREAGQIKPYSTLIFTIELVGIEQPKASDTKADNAGKTTSAKSAPAKKAGKKGRR